MANPDDWSIVRSYARCWYIESVSVRSTLQIEKFSYNFCHNCSDHFIELFPVFVLESINRRRSFKHKWVTQSEKWEYKFNQHNHWICFSVNFLFFAANTLTFISFLVLSLHWPQLMEYWQSIESLPIFRNFVNKTSYIRRIRLISASVLCLAFGTFYEVLLQIVNSNY